MFFLSKQQTKDILDGMPRWDWGFYKTWDEAKNTIEEMSFFQENLEDRKRFKRSLPRIKKCESGHTISLIAWSKAYKEASK